MDGVETENSGDPALDPDRAFRRTVLNLDLRSMETNGSNRSSMATSGLFPGESLFNFVSLAIALILFEGG